MSTARGERLRELWASRDLLAKVPTDLLLELPGRPAVLWCVRDYTAANWADPDGGAERGKAQAESARSDAPFLFKAFETGQIGPRRLARLAPEQRPRAATIHEYLDWTVTGRKAAQDGDYVSGFFFGMGARSREGIGVFAARKRKAAAAAAATPSSPPQATRDARALNGRHAEILTTPPHTPQPNP